MRPSIPDQRKLDPSRAILSQDSLRAGDKAPGLAMLAAELQ